MSCAATGRAIGAASLSRAQRSTSEPATTRAGPHVPRVSGREVEQPGVVALGGEHAARRGVGRQRLAEPGRDVGDEDRVQWFDTDRREKRGVQHEDLHEQHERTADGAAVVSNSVRGGAFGARGTPYAET